MLGPESDRKYWQNTNVDFNEVNASLHNFQEYKNDENFVFFSKMRWKRWCQRDLLFLSENLVKTLESYKAYFQLD